MPKTTLLSRFIQPFRSNGKLDPLIIILYAILNSIVIINAVFHFPEIGYDATQNLNYIQVLHHRLPMWEDSREFFSPPLPFALPALLDSVCEKFHPNDLRLVNDILVSWNCRHYDGKLAQGLDVLLSLGTTLLLLSIIDQIKRDNRFFKISALVLLCNLTVYYKAYSQVRAEPYVVFFLLLSIYLINSILKSMSSDWRIVATLGSALGCLLLSRQWGFFLFPAMLLLAVMIFIQNRQRGGLLIKQLAFGTAIGILVSGFFYSHLYNNYGSITAFNIENPTYPSLKQTYEFLRNTHLRNLELFRTPVRSRFNDSFSAMMYSETWGDYWGYLVYIGPNTDYFKNGYGNFDKIAHYLGRVNLVSIFPSLLLCAGFIFGLAEVFKFRKSTSMPATQMLFIYFTMFSTIAGYLWFVYSYFVNDPDVVKAAYIMQFFVLLLFSTAELMERIRDKWKIAYLIIIAVLMTVFVHNVPAMITRYNIFNLPPPS